MTLKKSLFNFISIIAICFSAVSLSACKPKENATEGLVYSLNEDGTYNVKDFKPVDKFAYKIEIPSTYKKKKVTSIGNECFNGAYNSNKSRISSIVLPSTITSIGDKAFYKTSLEELTISDSVKSIGVSAFAETTIKKLVIGDGLETIQGFEECNELKYVLFGKNVKTIETYAFYHCYSIESLELPEGLTTIGSAAFRRCSQLENIVIPSSVTSISHNAFDECKTLRYVFYTGTKNQWEDLIQNHTLHSNDPLLEATVIYNYKI